MDIHEYQAKGLLKDCGVTIADGGVAHSPDQAVAAWRELSCEKCVVKAQIHSGARGKAGGIIVCSNDEEVSQAANKLIDARLVTHQTGPRGKLVSKVYVEAASDIVREIYLAFVLDRVNECVVAVASSEGGMDIEELAESNPDAISRIPFDQAYGVLPFQARELSFLLGLTGDLMRPAIKIFNGCYQAMKKNDAILLEINPLAVTSDNQVIAMDAKMTIDDNALFRRRDIVAMRDKSQEDPRETKASDHDLSYVGLDGDIGCMINGAGLAMATMDMIKHVGGAPANFLDIGGAASPERVAKAFELVLEDTNVKAMLVNIYAGINRCDWIAEGIIKALDTVSVNVPLIVRLSGTNVEQGRKMIEDSGLPIITANTLSEAAHKAVEASQGS